jgi:hypothetical protein
MRLAHLLRTVRNLRMDLRFGGRFLGGTIATRFADLYATSVANSDYAALTEMFGRISIGPDDVIVDVGCGKGRALNFLLSAAPAQRIIGIELDPAVAAATAQRLRRYHRVTIVAGNILDHWPEAASVFYLYNPFGRPMVEKFAERLGAHPQPFIAVYYNCLHWTTFEHYGFVVEYHARSEVPAFRRRFAETSTVHDFCFVRRPVA